MQVKVGIYNVYYFDNGQYVNVSITFIFNKYTGNTFPWEHVFERKKTSTYLPAIYNATKNAWLLSRYRKPIAILSSRNINSFQSMCVTLFASSLAMHTYTEINEITNMFLFLRMTDTVICISV